MTKIGTIELPINRTTKAEGSDQDMIDLLLDLHVVNMNRTLTALNKSQMPVILLVKSNDYQLIILLIFLPPDIWLDFDGQQYQVYVSPNLQWLIHTFVEKRMKCNDPFELAVLTKIIDYMDGFTIKNVTTT